MCSCLQFLEKGSAKAYVSSFTKRFKWLQKWPASQYIKQAHLRKKKKYNTEASLGLKDLQILSQNTTFHNVQTLVLHFSVQLHLSNQVLGTYRLSLCS